MHDVLTNVPNLKIECLDKGFVQLVDCMPRLAPEGQTTADYAIVQAARVSYGSGTKTVNEDRGLIRYLLRHSHTTPYEMIEFKFCCKLPIFIARQMIRHRSANVNEYSGRYSVIKDEYYVPKSEDIKIQSKENKQGGSEIAPTDVADDFKKNIVYLADESYEKYLNFMDSGISREQARMLLPVSYYTEWYWKIDLHNLLHFLALRCDSHAQYEIRVFADAILSLIKPIVPLAVEAWEDYHVMRGAMKFTSLELEALKKSIQENKFTAIDSNNKREQSEWEDKAKKLGL